jgi:hypothetical protein
VRSVKRLGLPRLPAQVLDQKLASALCRAAIRQHGLLNARARHVARACRRHRATPVRIGCRRGVAMHEITVLTPRSATDRRTTVETR